MPLLSRQADGTHPRGRAEGHRLGQGREELAGDRRCQAELADGCRNPEDRLATDLLAAPRRTALAAVPEAPLLRRRKAS